VTEPDAAVLLARRESTIVLDREGHFQHEGSLIEHPGIVRAFRRWLTKGPGGRFVLRASDRDWCFLTVEGAATWIEDVALEGDRVTVGLWDGTREPLAPRALRLGADGVLAATVRGLPARFTRHAQLALGARLEPAADGEWVLAIGGALYRVRAQGPGA
jgi:hypothetical protein